MKTACKAVSLTCEGQVRPIGLAERVPKLSWLFEQGDGDFFQSAWRIIVDDSLERVTAETGGLWDSEKVTSPATYRIPYGGRPLRSRTAYFWRVCVWDADGNCSGFSEPAVFETGFLDDSDWQADWIGGFDLLRTEFAVRRPVARARLYATGLGYHEIDINGRKTSDQVLSPSFTDYKKRIEYVVEDVTGLLREGRNAVGIMLGNGWFLSPDRVRAGGMDGCEWFRNEKMALFQLEITYDDGTGEKIVSDGSWKGSAGPVTEDSVFYGEVYDATREQAGWDHPGFDEAGWLPVKKYDGVTARLVPQSLPPVKIVEEHAPLSIRRHSGKTWIVDFGINAAGWVQMKVRAARQTKITLRFAELLDKNGGLDMNTLEKATGTNVYICGGQGEEIYQPRFTYYGFRFMEVDGFPGEPDGQSFRRLAVHSAVRETGHFSCSDDLLNQVHAIMKRTLSNNLHSIPTDCCQRNERAGWMADAFLAAEACIYNFDMHAFYRKWLDDIADTCDPATGEITSPQAPAYTPGGYFTWNVAYPIVVKTLLDYYGDQEIVEKHYGKLKAFFAFTEKNFEEDGLLRQLRQDKFIRDGTDNLGDWLCVRYTQPNQLDNCMYYLFAGIMACLAKAGGHPEDALFFTGKAENIKDRFNAKYLEPVVKGSGYYNSLDWITQTGCGLPLFLGLVPPAYRELVEDHFLLDLTEARGESQLTTGIFGTKYVMEFMHQIGKSDVIYDLFSRTRYPGWGFMVACGATSVWERWEYQHANEMNSHNHPALASPDPLFWKSLAGIEWPHENEGRRVFNCRPYLSRRLGQAEARLGTPWGTASVKWRFEGNQATIELDIPPNTKGMLDLPGSEPTVFGPGFHQIVSKCLD